MTTYDWASVSLVPPARIDLQLLANTGFLASAVTQAVQTIGRPGERWELTCHWMNIYGDNRADLLAFFARLNGGEHRVRMPFFGQVQRGSLGGTPLVQGASQVGNSLVIDGATISQTGWIKAMDLLRWGGSIHMATADANSDGSGNVTIPIEPAIRNSPANNAPVIVTAAQTGIFILKSPVSFGSDSRKRLSDASIVSDLTLSFIDDVLAE